MSLEISAPYIKIPNSSSINSRKLNTESSGILFVKRGVKMIWSGEEVAKWISAGVASKQIRVQPNGVDLTVSEIYAFGSEGKLYEEQREMPRYEKLEGIEWLLTSGVYLVRYGEWIKIPPNAIGLVLPRSSLLRMGATIYTAVWDSGYEGRGIGLLHVMNPHGIKLKKGARIAQIIFISARSEKLYEGIWKGEGKESH